MTTCVIDTSVALAWCFEDELTSQSEKLLEEVAKFGAVVPNLWHLEICNALKIAEIRKRISHAAVLEQLENFSQLSINVDQFTATHAWSAILGIAHEFDLTSYDAAYVELAR